MKQSLLKFILFIFLCLSFNASFARHIKGGWIFYQYLGPGITDPSKLLYKVTVKVFRDCAIPDPNQNDTQIGITIFSTATGGQLNDIFAPLVAIDTLNKVSYSACINTNPPVCYHILRYEKTMELAPISGGYTLSYQRCCRTNGIINITAPSNQDGNTFTIRIPGNEINQNYPKNNSPVFAQNDTLLVCYKAQVLLDFSALDPDSDSLSYAFTPGITGGSATVPVQDPSLSPPFTAISYQAPYSANDPFGTGLKIDKNTGIISGFSPASTGEYVVAVSVKEYRGGTFIAETRKELHVSVVSCSFAEAILPNIQLLCNGFSTTFENNSLSSNNRSYTWDFGVKGITSDTSHLPTPTYSYPDTGVFTIKLIVNKGEQCSDSTTSVIHVYPGLHAGFYTTGICKDAPFHFFDTTVTHYGTVNSWAWNFGDALTLADTSNSQNPQYQYLDSGKNTVRLIASNTKGCFDTAYALITIVARPILTLPFHDTLICSIDTLQLFANSNIGNAFSWLPNSRIVNPNVQNPFVYPNFTTTYLVAVSNQGCSNKDSIKVNVLPYITVDAGPDTLICRSDATTLNPISQALSYKWTPTIYLNNPNIKQPVASPLVPSITYYVTANLGKCQVSDSVTIKTSPYPAATIRLDTSICFNTVVKLYATTNGNSYLWSPSNLVQNPRSLITLAYPKDTTVFTLIVSDTSGCPKPAMVMVKVAVVPKVQVFAGRDTSIVFGQPFLFQSTASSFANIYLWTPASGLNSVNILQPTAIITNAILGAATQITYYIKASTSIGCNATDSITVQVYKTLPTIFVPSAFTPNGDGKNDVIKPILAGMQRLVFFRIYNRYGQLVYETQQQNTGWDGRFNGQLQASAAFVFSAQAVDYNDKVVKQTGTFVLIR